MNLLYATLPINKKDVVVGRYAYSYVLCFVMAIIAFLGGNLLDYFSSGSIKLFETTITVLVCFFVYTLIQAFQIPMFFKLGYAKAKIFTFLPLITFAGLVILVSDFVDIKFFEPIILFAVNNHILTIVLVVLFWIIAQIISISFSKKFYFKREV